MKRGDPRLPIPGNDFMGWAQRLIVRLYDRFREIDTDVDQSLNFRYLTPSSVTLTTGGSTSALADLTTMLDGNVYHIDEVTGVPGFDLSLFFTNVTRIRFLVVRMYYAGAATHGCRVQLKNIATTNYDTLFIETGDWLDYNMICVPVPNFESYISSTGGVEARIYHTESGNASHNLDIDYVALLT